VRSHWMPKWSEAKKPSGNRSVPINVMLHLHVIQEPKKSAICVSEYTSGQYLPNGRIYLMG
jgi:hypothetical protein